MVAAWVALLLAVRRHDRADRRGTGRGHVRAMASRVVRIHETKRIRRAGGTYRRSGRPRRASQRTSSCGEWPTNLCRTGTFLNDHLQFAGLPGERTASDRHSRIEGASCRAFRLGAFGAGRGSEAEFVLSRGTRGTLCQSHLPTLCEARRANQAWSALFQTWTASRRSPIPFTQQPRRWSMRHRNCGQGTYSIADAITPADHEVDPSTYRWKSGPTARPRTSPNCSGHQARPCPVARPAPGVIN